MWLFTTSGFLSIVDKGGDGTTLLVRARRKGEIESIFPDAVVVTSPRNDYLYRARIDREQVAQTMAEMIRNLGYQNFKATIQDTDFHDACMDVWEVMYRYQNHRLKR
jgi:predicted transposase YdaD